MSVYRLTMLFQTDLSEEDLKAAVDVIKEVVAEDMETEVSFVVLVREDSLKV